MKRLLLPVFLVFAALLPLQARAECQRSCQCWYHTPPADEPACITFCDLLGWEYAGFDGTDQCSCSTSGDTAPAACPDTGNLGGGSCSFDANCASPTPEMPVALVPLFLLGAGSLFWLLRRRKDKTA